MPRSGPALMLVELSPSGGLFQFALQLGEAMARRRRRVELLTGRRPELASREPGCLVRGILPTWHPMAGEQSPGWWRRIRRVIRAARLLAAWLIVLTRIVVTRPEVVLFSTWRFALDAWFVQAIHRLAPRVRLGIVAHEPRPLVEQPGSSGMYKAGDALESALRGAWSAMDHVFVLGESTRTQLLESWPVRCPVTVIPHGDEGALLRSGVPPVDETSPNALFFGTITAYKGLDDLLQAWPAVVAALPQARLTVAGAIGADMDRKGVLSRIGELPNVTARAGYVPVEAVPELFGDARCVVLPYRRSSQSGVAHLAFTFGRPVVATTVGDVPAVVRDGDTGRLVPPGDVPALAQAIISLLEDPLDAGRMGANGRSLLAESSTWDDVASLVDGVLWPA